MKRICLLVLFCLCWSQITWAARTKIDDIARDPYVSAMVVNADTGKILFEEHAETVVYPASVLKLMDLLVILEQIEQGKVQLNGMVQVTREAARMGGSQVYLDPKEQFSVEDLLYALAVQSANDAAVALAVHVAGSTEGFIALMNRRAKELGMKDTQFHSVHGLPPAKGQKPDETTAYDLSILGRELAQRPDIFKYTGTKERPIRDGQFIMRNHNHLLDTVAGCDGFKTGYFQAAGFSIVATAKRGGVRIIAIVMGSKDRKVRDAKAAELLAKGFSLAATNPESAAATKTAVTPVTNPAKFETDASSPEPETFQPPIEQKLPAPTSSGGWGMFFIGVGVGLALAGILVIYISRKRSNRSSNYRRYR
jgi:serine-type D-Ala-D-Ala carboxypeptidase (penicillin-binding protein 5/6)